MSEHPHHSPPLVAQEVKPVVDNEIQEVPTPSDAEVAGEPPTLEQTGFKGWWAKWGFEIKLLLALLLPVFVETLDYTVVASAQPQIASAFNRLDLQTWVGTSYVLTSTAFLPLCGNIADILGRHTALQIGFVVFFIGSVLSTAAQNMPMVLAGRGLSGVGAAFLLVVVRIIFSDNRSVTVNAWRTVTISFLFGVGYGVGPIIGGALVSVNFRWIFAINLPIALTGSILAFITIRHQLLGPRPDPRNSLFGWRVSERSHLIVNLARVDWIAAAFFTIGAFLVLVGLSWGSTEKWRQAKVISCITIGGVLLIIFLGWEYWLGKYEVRFNPDGSLMYPDKPHRIPPWIVSHMNRMLPLWIFTNYQIPIVFYSSFTGGMVMFGCLYFLAIYWSIVAGYENTRTGTQLVWFTPGLGGGSWLSFAMITWWRQPRYCIILGQTAQAVAVGLIGLSTSQNKYPEISGFLGMAGAGIGLTIATLDVQSRFLLPPEQNAVSTTMNLFFRTAGGTVGLAQLSTVLESKLRSYIFGLIKSGKLSVDDALKIAQGLTATGGHQSASPGIANLPPHLQQVVKDAYGYGVKWAFYSLLPWCSLAALMVYTLGDIVDTDRVEREKKKLEEKNNKSAENEASAAAVGTGVSGGDEAQKTESGQELPTTSTGAKLKREAGD